VFIFTHALYMVYMAHESEVSLYHEWRHILSTRKNRETLHMSHGPPWPPLTNPVTLQKTQRQTASDKQYVARYMSVAQSTVP